MTEFDDSDWTPIERHSDFEEAMRPDEMVEMFRGLMEVSNREGHPWFIICNQIIEEREDKVMLGPEIEGELVGVEGQSDEAILILKDVTIMQANNAPEPELIEYTTLEQRKTMRIPIATIGDPTASNPRIGNDYIVKSKS